MTKEILEKELKTAGIPEYLYNLTGHGRTDERYCMEQMKDQWFVYYEERGIKTTNKCFDTEDEACKFIYDKLIK